MKRLALMIGLLALAGTPGCAVVGWVVAQSAPPKKVPAVYDPPKQQTWLVFVDDLMNPVDYQPVKRELAENISRELKTKDVAVRTVDYEDLMDLTMRRDDFNSMGIPEIGRELNADLVLYVHLDEFQLREDDVAPLWQGKMKCTVKVVDSREGRLWPDDRPKGFPLPLVETPQEVSQADSFGRQVAERLADKQATQIVRLFHEHEVPRRPFAKNEPRAYE